ncbi:NAD-dependent protein deacylase Cob2 [Bacillaceae bacterium]
MLSYTILDVARLIREGDVVVLTGAGMSTESGLPDFRSSGGLWHGKDPMKIASTVALAHHFAEFTEFYRYRIQEKNKHRPHVGHELLAKWEKQGLVKGIITQNVDGYHNMAGSRRVYPIHGSLSTIYCASCGREYDEEQYMKQNFCACGGKIRPGIVLFGEALPEETFAQALAAARSCRTLLVIGTSLQVAPANLLPREARSCGAKVILLNREPIEEPYWVDAWIEGSAKEILKAVDEELAKMTA